ncbi:hypothetical protein BT93_E0330 [Corymbia citriodora subsp. variegata]|nr:hypothetical protein BT93_E0330 [Corymbia citriodora subsp. variegata]
MRMPSRKMPFLFLMILLFVSQLSSCRNIHGFASDRRHEEPLEYRSRRLDFRSQIGDSLQLHLSGKATVGSSGDQATDPIFGASMRTTPGGPNPLHN